MNLTKVAPFANRVRKRTLEGRRPPASVGYPEPRRRGPSIPSAKTRKKFAAGNRSKYAMEPLSQFCSIKIPGSVRAYVYLHEIPGSVRAYVYLHVCTD